MPLRPRVDFHDRLDGRLSVASVAVIAAIGILAWRLYALQFLQGELYATKAARNYTRVEEIPALRGRVFDRYGRILVDTVRTYALGIETYTAESRRIPLPEIHRRLDRLAEVIDASPEVLRKRFVAARPDRQGRVVVQKDIDFNTLVAVQENRLILPGVRVIRSFRRHTVHHDTACHVLGYVNELSSTELQQPQYTGFVPGDEIGRAGVEQVYDSYLRGTKGQRVLKVHYNEIAEQEINRIDSRPGSDLHLTLDLHLQLAAERVLGASPGAVVVMDVTSGEILALACYPRYDPNLVGSIGWNDVLRDHARPLYHRAISGAHAPGSILKVMMAAAGLLEGVVSKQTTFHCSGRFSGLGQSYRPRCWIGGMYGWGHGHMDVSDAVKQSCDIYFYNLALKLGGDRLRSWGLAFGLGARTGIDLPGENPGRLPDCRYPGDLVQAGIGQERWLVTPLQAAVMTAMIANGGLPVRPRVGQYIQHSDGRREEIHPPAEITPNAWNRSALETVRHAMWRVVQEPRGTAYSQRIPGFEYAGKTGSAEHRKGAPTHAWFVAYAPGDQPRYVLAAFVESAGHGGSVAAPVVRELLLKLFPQKEESS